MQMLEESLTRLQTDHLDVWQVHEVVYYNDPEKCYTPDGVLEALAAAKQQGKVRFVGFTGHKNPSIHLAMLNGGFPFDTVQMPLNPFDYSYRSFQREVLPVATTTSGVSELPILEQNLRVAQNFSPLSAAEMQALRDRAKPYAGDGRFELYKTSIKFDNPEARLAHEFPIDMQQTEVKQMVYATQNSGRPFPQVSE